MIEQKRPRDASSIARVPKASLIVIPHSGNEAQMDRHSCQASTKEKKTSRPPYRCSERNKLSVLQCKNLAEY